MIRASGDVGVGTTHKTNRCGIIEVVAYKDSQNVTVKFNESGYITTVSSSTIRNGEVKDATFPNVVGVGYIGVGNHNSKDLRSIYMCWHNMLSRCYNKASQKYRYYGGVGVSVCDEWHNFQCFARWYLSECDRLGIPADNNKHEIDKDIGNDGSVKSYRPSQCRLVTSQRNKEEAHAKSYAFTNPAGQIVKIYNLSKYCRENSLNNTSMVMVDKGKRLQHKGWVKHVE